MKRTVSAMSGSRGKRPHQSDNDSFETFLEEWLVRQEHFLDELQSTEHITCHDQSSSDDEHLRDLITRVLAHYQQYYERKSIAAEQDVFRLFGPNYFSSLEQSFLWIAGFKPGLALKLVSSVVMDLSEEQKVRLQKLIEQTRIKERLLDNELAKVQESLAAPPILEALRGFEVSGYLNETMETVREGLESVVGNADSLRTTTAAKVVELLSPVQNVRFFTAVTRLQVNVRILGKRRDAEQHWKADGRWW